MFCKICQNFMDITNNISFIEKKQEGGDSIIDNGLSSDFDSVDTTEIDTENESKIISTNITNKLIENFLGGKSNESNYSDESDELESSDKSDKSDKSDNKLKSKKPKLLDLEELIKNPTFNKLSNTEKTILINKINEQNNKEIGQISKTLDSVINNECYFYCKTCGYYELIPDKMFIFSRGDEKKDDIYNFNFVNYKKDPTLPNTKKYNCINDKCFTHKEPKLKNAIFYRQKGSYSTRYICSVCDSFWNTFIEK